MAYDDALPAGTTDSPQGTPDAWEPGHVAVSIAVEEHDALVSRAEDLARPVEPFCTCEADGETFTDHWFDRSICPEPCGSMHDVCVECGRIKGGCPLETAGQTRENAVGVLLRSVLTTHAATATGVVLCSTCTTGPRPTTTPDEPHAGSHTEGDAGAGTGSGSTRTGVVNWPCSAYQVAVTALPAPASYDTVDDYPGDTRG